jgi:hypothetical protein
VIVAELMLAASAGCFGEGPAVIDACKPILGTASSSGTLHVLASDVPGVTIDSMRWSARKDSPEASYTTSILFQGRTVATVAADIQGTAILYELPRKGQASDWYVQTNLQIGRVDDRPVLLRLDSVVRTVSPFASIALSDSRVSRGREPDAWWGCPASARFIRLVNLPEHVGLLATVVRDSAERLDARRRSGALRPIEILADTFFAQDWSGVLAGVAMNTSRDTIHDAAVWYRVKSQFNGAQPDTIVVPLGNVLPGALVPFARSGIAKREDIYASGTWVHGEWPRHILAGLEDPDPYGDEAASGPGPHGSIGREVTNYRDLPYVRAGVALMQYSPDDVGSMTTIVAQRIVTVHRASSTKDFVDTASIRLSPSEWKSLVDVIDSAMRAKPSSLRLRENIENGREKLTVEPAKGHDILVLTMPRGSMNFTYDNCDAPPEFVRLLNLLDSLYKRAAAHASPSGTPVVKWSLARPQIDVQTALFEGVAFFAYSRVEPDFSRAFVTIADRHVTTSQWRRADSSSTTREFWLRPSQLTALIAVADSALSRRKARGLTDSLPLRANTNDSRINAVLNPFPRPGNEEIEMKTPKGFLLSTFPIDDPPADLEQVTGRLRRVFTDPATRLSPRCGG